MMHAAPAAEDSRVSVTDTIQTIDQLDNLLSEPPDSLVQAFARLPGDIIVLGVAGKMGPTLARMARRASRPRRHGAPRHRRRAILGSEPASRGCERHGVETHRCDLLDARAVARLPDAPLVVYMAGRKFGSTGQESLTWAMNAAVPVHVSAALRGQPHRRVLDRQRVRPDADERRRLARDGSAGAGRRIRDELPRARTHLRALQPFASERRRQSCA